MCGIAGVFLQNNKPVSSEVLKKMCDVMKHRGPEDEGQYIDGSIGLGHRRLKIIDLSPKAHQPMSNEDGTIWLVFSGEIYNFLELTSTLKKRGHRFRSRSDTEVVIHAYEEYGEDCLHHFNGMFAFAIWDKNNQKLFLARDRLGIKPLYYAHFQDNFLFASEVKAILQYPEINPEINPKSLDYYLTFRYVAGPLTIFKGINKLLPAHTLTYQKGKIRIKNYWQIQMKEEIKQHREEYYQERFLELLKDSIRLRLISDVPLGVFLSGGIDSSSLVGLMTALGQKPIKTFSIGFGTQYDELEPARLVSNLFGTEHHQIIAKSEDLNLLPKIVWHLDEPIGDAIIIPMYLLSKLTQEHVKVILTGEGADELLGGYIHQKTMYWGELYSRSVPGLVRRNLINPLIRATPLKILDCLFSYPAFLGKKGKTRFLEYLSLLPNKSKSYLSLASLFTEKERRELYTADLAREVAEFNPFEKEIRSYLESSQVARLLNRILLLEFHTWLPDYTLLKQDKTLMANSVEGRVPFLDHRLVEFVASLPAGLKLHRFTDKYILRKALKGLLPKAVVKRKKQAFRFPTEERFQKRLDELVGDFLSESSIKSRGYFNCKYVKRLLKVARESRELVYHKQVISLLILEIWFRAFIDRE